MTGGAAQAPGALIVALGPGEPELVPAAALAALRAAGRRRAARAAGSAERRRWPPSASRFDDAAATVCAPDRRPTRSRAACPACPRCPSARCSRARPPPAAAGRAARADRRPAARMPLGSRADGDLDRAAHRRGGLRGGRCGARVGALAEADRRARRPALPDDVPGAAVRGGGRRRVGGRRARRGREAARAPPLGVRAPRARRRQATRATAGRTSRSRARGARGSSTTSRAGCRRCCRRASCSGAPPRSASTTRPPRRPSAISRASSRSCAPSSRAARAGGGARAARGRSSARSATSSSPASTSRAATTAIPSSRCARRAPASASAWSAPSGSPRPGRRLPGGGDGAAGALLSSGQAVSQGSSVTTIASVHARQILDSRGNPTVEVDVVTDDGRARPRRRALGGLDRLARGDRAPRRGLRLRRQGRAGRGRERQRRARSRADRPGRARPARRRSAALRARRHAATRAASARTACSGASLAVAKASAAALGLPLWRSLGGPVRARAARADDERHQRRRARRQRASTCRSSCSSRTGPRAFAEALRIGSEVYHALKARLHRDGLSTAVGDEGGFAPEISSAEAAIELILAAAGDAGHADAVGIALDPAMTELYRDGAYHARGPRAELRAARRLVERALRPLPDPLARGCDVRGRLGRLAPADPSSSAPRVQLVGDDLFVTNPKRLAEGIEAGAANAILVKVNQIGTLSESLDAIALGARAGYAP